MTTAGAVTVSVTAAAIVAFPVFVVPAPSGRLPVGTHALHLVDTQRQEIFDDSDRPRELMVQLWYPAQARQGRRAPVIPDSPAVIGEMARGFGLPANALAYLPTIKSHSWIEAPLATSERPYPLLLLNHGYGSAGYFHTTQAENLASHGYVVAAIDHTYSSLATRFPDGRVTTMRTDEERIGEYDYRSTVGEVWTKDIQFTLGRLAAMNDGTIPSMFTHALDMDRVGVLGHSFGGAAAYDAMRDSRIRAGIDLDGTLYGFRGRPPTTKPFMFVYSAQAFDLYDKARRGFVYSDRELADLGITRAEMERDLANLTAEREHIRAVARAGGPVVYIEGTKHNNFMDQQLFSPLLRLFGLVGDIDPYRSITIVNDYLLAFFDEHLRGHKGALHTGPDPGHPEVRFATSDFAQ
ncbi:hypothetical protein [Nocardia sp. NPDC051981]|uniref:alpha/beta hydrolase family protein n=1 Tax=Nocardia sp. NPDC051981 TaxID=3155417 RepID=UPI0034386B62